MPVLVRGLSIRPEMERISKHNLWHCLNYRNQWYSCQPVSIDDNFKGKDPLLRETFDQLTPLMSDLCLLLGRFFLVYTSQLSYNAKQIYDFA